MSKKKRRTKNDLRPWLLGIAATVVASLVTGAAIWLGPEIFDDAATRDAVRDATGYDDDLRYHVQFLDPGYDLILPRGVELTAKQRRFLENWSLDYEDPSGYGLNDLMDELRSMGGANPSQLLLSIALEGRRNQPIHVDDIRPVDIRHSDPYDGTFLNVPPQGPGETVKIVFDFDEIEPRARTAVDKSGAGEYEPGGLFFQEQTLTINDAKQDTIFIKSITTRQAVTFDISIDYRIGDERKSLRIDNEGRPFALSPMNCTSGHASYQHVWSLTGDFEGIEPAEDPERFDTSYC